MRMLSARLLLLGLACLSALVSANHHHEHRDKLQISRPVDMAPRFAADKQYVFEWDSQMVTGMTAQTQNALQRLHALVNVHFTSEKTAVVQLDEIELRHLNDELPAEMLEIQPLKGLKQSTLRDSHLETLRIPFEIRYEQGKVAELYFEQKDQPWSENLKRSAVNHLQIQLDTDEQVNSFRTDEITIEGKCESIYSVLPQEKCQHQQEHAKLGEQQKGKEQCVRVMSTINFDRCTRVPELRYNFHRSEVNVAGNKQDESLKIQNALDKSSNMEVELQKQADGTYMPIYVRSVAHYSVPVSSSNQMQMNAVVRSELKLKEIRTSTTSPELDAKKTAQSLEFSTESDHKLEYFYETGNVESSLFHPYMTKMNIPDVVMNVIRRLVQSFVADQEKHWQLDSEAAHQFTNLVKVLRFATEDDLQMIHKNVCEGSDAQTSAAQKKFAREIMIDALALAGTKTTAMHLLEKFEKKEVQEWKISQSLYKLAKNIPFVGQDLLNAVWARCETMQKGSKSQRTCVLSWSRMVNVMCGANHQANHIDADEWAMNKRRAAHCSTEIRADIAKTLKQLMKDAGSDEEQQILSLKAWGNTGLEIMIPELKKIIENPKIARLVRIVAIDAMRMMPEQSVQEVQNVLMPVVLNRREHPEVRMNAMHQLLKSRPSKPIIDQIAAEITLESNLNMRSYTISALNNVAKQIQQIDTKCAEEMKNAVKLIQATLTTEQQEKLQQTPSRYLSMIIGEQAGILSTAALFSNDSHLPKEVMVQLDSLFNDHFLPAFAQLGVHQQNVEQLIGKLFQNLEDKTIGEIFVRGKRSTLSQLYNTPVKYMKTMFEKLSIVSRRANSERPQLMFYRREQNMDVSYNYLDEKHLPQLVKDLFINGQIDMTALETNGERVSHWIDADLGMEQRVKIPTLFGVPLIYTARMCHLSNIRTAVRLELESESGAIRAGHARLNLLPKVSANLVYKLEAVSPLFTAGVRTQHNVDAQIPLRVSAQYKRDTKGLTFDLELPQNKEHIYKLFQISSHPSTLYRQWPEQSKIFVEPEERTLIVPQMQSGYRQMDVQTNCPLSGMRVELRGHYHSCDNADCWMAGENAMEMHVHVNEQTAKKLRMQIQLNELAQSGEQQQIFERASIQHLFEKDAKSKLFVDAEPNEIDLLKEFSQRTVVAKSPVYKLHIQTQALDINGKQQRAIHTQLQTTCARSLRTCTVDFKTSKTDSDWSARFFGQFSRPELTGIYGSMKSAHVLAHAEFQWGTTEQKNTVSVCTYGRPSKQSIAEWNQMISLRSADRRMKSEHFENMEDDEYDQMVMRSMPRILTANRFNMAIEQQLSKPTSKSIRQFMNYILIASNPIRALFSSIETGEHNRLNAELTVEPTGQWKVSMNDMTHTQRLPKRLSNIMDSTEWSQENDWSDKESTELKSQPFRSLKNTIQHVGGASCFMDKEFNVRSFDGNRYKVPLSTCYTVLAKDCGSSEEQQFSVLAKRLNKDTKDIKVKLVIPSHIYTLYQENKKIVVRANDIVLRESEYEKYGIQVVKEALRQILVFHCEITGMEMRFDGQNLEVRLPEEYVNKQCGVCGHYNRDASDNFRKQDNTLAESMKEFHASYLYRDNECQSEAIDELDKRTEDQYRYKSSESDESMDKENMNTKKNYNTIKPQPKTYVMEFQNQICFSNFPLQQCPRGYAPLSESNEVQSLVDEDSSEKQSFVCWERKSHKTQKMLRRVQREGVVDELKDQPTSKKYSVHVPKQCISVQEDRDDYN